MRGPPRSRQHNNKEAFVASNGKTLMDDWRFDGSTKFKILAVTWPIWPQPRICPPSTIWAMYRGTKTKPPGTGTRG